MASLLRNRREKRRAKSRRRRTYQDKIESCVGPLKFKMSPEYKLLKEGFGNRDNPLHEIISVKEGPGYKITTYLDANDLLSLSQITTKTDVALSDSMSEEVEQDVLFKRFWEENKLDEYYYSVPMVYNWPKEATRVLYKIKKTDVDEGSYKEDARHPQHSGAQYRQIGCLNYITFGGKNFRIYDFPYTAPGLEKPVEFKLKNGREDVTWKNLIRQRYRNRDTSWDEALTSWDEAIDEDAGVVYEQIMDGIKKKTPIEQRYCQFFPIGNEISKQEFKNIYENEILSEYYLDQQKRWVKDVFYMSVRGEPIKHVELKSATQQVIDMLKGTYECCDRACKRITKSFQESCILQGGRRKRTRRRRKKNRKKRTKKRARRKRRRKSTKRRRRRKR